MTDLTAALTVLDRLTDPLPIAIEDTRRTLEELFAVLANLKTATVNPKAAYDDGDRLWEVQFLAGQASEAFDVLAAEVERRQP